jgi:hypothetical protein
MTDPLTIRVRKTLKDYGDQAAAHFGVKQATLDGYIKRGKYPLSFIGKILADQPDAPVEQPEGPQPPPQDLPPPAAYAGDLYNSGFGVDPNPPRPEPQPRPQPQPAPRPTPPPQESFWDAGAALTATNERVQQIVDYIQGTIDLYIKQFSSRIDLLEKHMAFVRANQMRAAVGSASLTRPDAMAPVEQVFTTNPNAAVAGYPSGNNWDTGVAPTKAMVDAQAAVPVMEGVVPMRGAELARPATFIPDQPSFGYGWNIPRQRK